MLPCAMQTQSVQQVKNTTSKCRVQSYACVWTWIEEIKNLSIRLIWHQPEKTWHSELMILCLRTNRTKRGQKEEHTGMPLLFFSSKSDLTGKNCGVLKYPMLACSEQISAVFTTGPMHIASLQIFLRTWFAGKKQTWFLFSSEPRSLWAMADAERMQRKWNNCMHSTDVICKTGRCWWHLLHYHVPCRETNGCIVMIGELHRIVAAIYPSLQRLHMICFKQAQSGTRFIRLGMTR